MDLELDERAAGPLQLELDDRIAVRPSLESLRDLIEYWQFGGDPMMSPPLCLGWDIHRHWPVEGFEIWCDMRQEWEPPFLATELLPGDMRKAVTLEKYDAALIEQ